MEQHWTRERLEDLTGQAETLVMEFKRQESLLARDAKDTQARFDEAARDVAAMANEAGGTIIYGIEEDEVDGVRRAVAIGPGFSVPERMNRERFLQLMSTRIQPPIRTLAAEDVDLGDGRHALWRRFPRRVGERTKPRATFSSGDGTPRDAGR